MLLIGQCWKGWQYDSHIFHYHCPHKDSRLPLPGNPGVVGMSSCAAGHDRPMLGPASELYSTEQLIDRPHRGGQDSSYVCQKAAVMKMMSARTVTVPPGPLQLANVSSLAEGDGGRRSTCSWEFPLLLAVMCCHIWTGRAVPYWLPSATRQKQKQRHRHAACPESVHFTHGHK